MTKNVADGIMVVLNHRVVFVNDALVKMSGYVDSTQLIGKDVSILISDEFQDQFRQILCSFRKNDHAGNIFQTICVTREGRKFWAEGNNALINWNDEAALLCTMRDINDKKIKELEIQARAENLQQINKRLKASIKERFRFCDIIGKSPAMQKVYELLSVQPTPIPMW